MIENIKFISDITVRLIQKVGGDQMVCAAAKVSTSGEEAANLVDEEANAGLINYLVKMRHGTPLEHSSLTFFTHAPIFVYRELHRHRIGVSFNEESGRYKQLEPVFWIPRRDRKLIPSIKHKSARPDFVQCEDDKLYDELIVRLKDTYSYAYLQYQQLLDSNIAKEVARACLPVAIYSSCWFTCNPRSLMHFLSLRTHDKAAMFISYPQAEIEELARACEEMFKQGWPLCYKAFCDNKRVAP